MNKRDIEHEMGNTATALTCNLCGALINTARDVYHVGNGAQHSSYDECVRAHERRQGPTTNHQAPAHAGKLAAVAKPAGNINVLVLDLATLKKLARPTEQPTKERWYKRLFRRKR